MGIQINGNTNNINAGIGSLSIEDINELDIVGVATAANFKTGVSNLHDVGLTLTVTSNTTVNPPASASSAYTHFAEVELADGVELIIEDGDALVIDVLGLDPT